MMKKVSLIILFIFSVILTGCKSRSNDELIMATEAGFAPYEYYENGEIVGVDVDIANEIAKSMGKKLVIKDVAFDSIISEIKSDKSDFGAAGMSITEERQKEVDFTIEYTTSNQVVVVKKDSNFTINDLDNKKFSVQLGSVADMYVSDKYDESQIIRQKKYLSAAEDIKNNKADCIIMDSLPAEALVKANTNLKVLDGILFTDKYGMIVKKSNTELLNKINEVLEKLLEENKINSYILKHSK